MIGQDNLTKWAMRGRIGVRIKALGVKAIQRTALVGLVLVTAVSVSRGWDTSLALAAVGTWSATGSMTIPRAVHTATRLPNGKVLVAGGSLATRTELYDPAAGTWTASGSMLQGHSGHTATLLLNGKVLVAGGDCCTPAGQGDFIANAELYDPSSGTWSATGTMTTPRSNNTATLLPSGKVLVAGGVGLFFLASAELYDPVTGTWSTTGTMSTIRISHTATLLTSGKVLVAGGFFVAGGGSSNGQASSAELYDPVAGTWSATGGMANARQDQTATLLPSGKVLVAGGFGSNSTLASAELYDPVVGNWSATGNMANARERDTATLLDDGRVLVAGGHSSESFDGLSSAVLYDPAAGAWSVTGAMANVRLYHTATLLRSGKVLVAGGNGSSSTPTSAELYNPMGIPAPSCGLTSSGTDASRHTFIDITVQDPNSGLRLVKVTESNNARVAVPSFTVGSTSAQVVVATKIDQTRTSQLALQVTNVAGQVTNCDPILTEVGRDGPHGVPRTETFHHVAQGESAVTILNGTPGLTRLRLVVNRHALEVAGLTDGETRLVDVSSAMRGGDNTLTLIAQGKREGTASILIADK